MGTQGPAPQQQGPAAAKYLTAQAAVVLTLTWCSYIVQEQPDEILSYKKNKCSKHLISRTEGQDVSHPNTTIEEKLLRLRAA